MVYADYAATHPYVKYPSSAYGPFLNPNANYAYKEKRLLTEAENRVKKAIGAKSGKVVFGGTSSQLIENLMNRAKRNTVICSSYEHNSFYRYAYDSVKNISELSKNIANMPENYGKMIVMWQAVQNITGEIFPTKQIGELIHKYNGFYICDGTAQVGHTPIEPNIDDWCDFYVFSGHKLGTELGIGCCWISDRLDKWLNGFKLHGTPNLAGELAMTHATEDAIGNVKDNVYYWVDLYCYLKKELEENGIEYSVVIGGAEWGKWTPAINAIRLPRFNARTLQSYLASKEIYIGLGQSSCADKADRRVLCQGYGLSEQEADEVVRISFDKDSNVEDVKVLVKNICEFKKIYLDN